MSVPNQKKNLSEIKTFLEACPYFSCLFAFIASKRSVVYFSVDQKKKLSEIISPNLKAKKKVWISL